MGRPCKRDRTREKLTERVAVRIPFSTSLRICEAAAAKQVGETDVVREIIALGLTALERDISEAAR